MWAHGVFQKDHRPTRGFGGTGPGFGPVLLARGTSIVTATLWSTCDGGDEIRVEVGRDVSKAGGGGSDRKVRGVVQWVPGVRVCSVTCCTQYTQYVYTRVVYIRHI